MVPTIQATQAREGIEISEELASQAYYIVTEGEKAAFFDLQGFRGSHGEADQRQEFFIRTLGGKIENVRFDVAHRDFFEVPGVPLAYKRIAIIAKIFREALTLDPHWGIASQGLATADDSRFVRFSWEIPRDDKGKDWVPFAKGGDFSRFYADISLRLLWRDNGREIRSYERAYIRNETYYFRPGLTWPLRTQRGFNVRIMPPGCIFGHKGPAIFPSDPDQSFFILGVANSSAAESILHELMSFGSWEVGVIKRLPIPNPNAYQNEIISRIAESIYHAKANWDFGNEVSTSFKKPWLIGESATENRTDVKGRLDQLGEYESNKDGNIQKLYSDLNDEVYRLYGIPELTRKVMDQSLGERPKELVWPQMEGKSREQKRMEHVWRLLSYIVKSILELDGDGIVPTIAMSGEPSLMDQLYKELERLLPGQSISHVEVDILNELKRKVKGYRSTSSILEWLEDVFFEYHVSLYKNRPIFWHISSAQGRNKAAFGALVHYHKLDKNCMAKLRGTYLREAIELFRREAALAAQERREADRLEWQAKLEEAQDLDRRLQLVQEGYHEGAEGGDNDFRILTPWKSSKERPKGWDPDLDDGVKVNIEPFQKAGVLRIAKVV